MKSNIIGIVGALIILVALLAGCTSNGNTNDTQEKILANVKPIAEKWFEANMPDVKDISVEIDKKREFYGVVAGSYYKDSKKYWYWLNVDTEEFCSEEYYELLVQYIQERLLDGLGIECKEIDIPVEAAVIHGKDGYSTSCPWTYYRFSTNEIADIADKEMSKGDKEIRVYGALGLAYFNLKHYDEAIEALNIGLKANPRDLSSSYHLALCYYSVGNAEKARVILEGLRKTLPPDSQVLKNVLELLQRM